ncbi:MAG: DUF2341 domain-containing protein [Flammeovirgaceae bacterium]
MRSYFLFILLLTTCHTSWGQHLSNWQYQQVLTIDNTENSSPLIDYQVYFTLNTQSLIRKGQLEADGRDIRLVDLEGKKVICHWIEGALGTKDTKIWLKIDRVELKSLQQVLLLYGNPQAPAIADPSCVFNLFEGFDQAQLDTNKWETHGNGRIKITNGIAHLSAEDTDQLIRTNQSFDMPIIAEAFITKAAGRRLSLALIQDADPLWFGYTLSWEGQYREMYLNATDAEVSPCGGFSFFKDLFGSKAPNPVGQWSISWLTKNQIFGQWPDGSINEGNTLLHFKPLKVAIGVNACSADLNYKGELEVDWIRIRKLAMNEPKVSLQAPEKNKISSVANPLEWMG